MSARLLLLLVALLARVCLVTLATPSSFPAFSSAKVLASSLAASAGRPVLCAPASHGGGLDGGVSVCAAAAAELRPPPLVTVVSTLFRVEDALAAAWLADVGRQTVAAQVEVLCGLVAGNYAEPVTDLLGKALASGAADPSTYALRVVLFDTDPGLYATWSFMFVHVASQQSFLTNWNPDDRRAPHALARQVAALGAKPWVDLVAGPVLQFTTSPVEATWASVRAANGTLSLRLVSGSPLPRLLTLADFGKLQRGIFSVANPPHNAPLFRPRLLAHVGVFDLALDPISDWELWVRAVVANRSLHFLESPLQAWHRSDGQYSAVRAGARGAAVAAVLARYCAAWRAALAGGGAQLDVCAAPVLPREKSTRETADG